MQGTFLALFVAAVISALLGLIPGVGWLLSLIALFVLVSAMTGARFWPDVVCTVAVAWCIQFLLVIVVLAALMGD